MIIGKATVTANAVVTHRDSFLLASVSVVSVRRPYLASALLLAAGLGGFGMAFADLLYLHEQLTLTGLSLGFLLAGSQVAQLTLLSRDLKNTEQSTAIWGTPGELQGIRHQIDAERQRILQGGERHA